MNNSFISCGSFVVLSDNTLNKKVIFGKNSARPQNEAQAVVYIPGKSFEKDSIVKCTFIEIPQVDQTYSVILSQPISMWGAEMGSNEFGVVICNEPIQNINTDKNKFKDCALLGIDYVRLGLERSKTGNEALNVITKLLTKYDQRFTKFKTNSGHLTFENSFLIIDKNEAYILETVGKHWVAEKIVSGYRALSNQLTITNKIYKMSEDLKKYALDNNLWNEKEEFNFEKIFSSKKVIQHKEIYNCKNRLLKKYCENKNFDIFSMLKILRNTEFQICKSKNSDFPTQASQISILSDQWSTHWFTGTPDPEHSVFKPFVFIKEDFLLTNQISEPIAENSLKHWLYLKHENIYNQLKNKNNSLNQTLRNLEISCILELQAKTNQDNLDLHSELGDLFNDVVEAEIRFYK